MSQEQILLDHFKGSFLQGLAMSDPRVITSLHRAYCLDKEITAPLEFEFPLSSLFEALCISCGEHELEIQINNWKASFDKFCQLLMSPWPEQEIAAAGYKIKLVRRSRSLATTHYKISTIQIAQHSNTHLLEQR